MTETNPEDASPFGDTMDNVDCKIDLDLMMRALTTYKFGTEETPNPVLAKASLDVVLSGVPLMAHEIAKSRQIIDQQGQRILESLLSGPRDTLQEDRLRHVIRVLWDSRRALQNDVADQEKIIDALARIANKTAQRYTEAKAEILRLTKEG